MLDPSIDTQLRQQFQLDSCLRAAAERWLYLGRPVQSPHAPRHLIEVLRAESCDVSVLRAHLHTTRSLAVPQVLNSELGESSTGWVWLSTPCPAQHLSAFLQRNGPLPPERVYALLAQLADALRYAHQADLVHGFLDAMHVLVDDDGEQDRLFIFGFGSAHRLPYHILPPAAPPLLLGSPGYLAPELFTGHAPSQASDIYAAALLAVEMLTGRPVYPQDDPARALAWSAQGQLEIPHDIEQDGLFREHLAPMLLRNPVERRWPEALSQAKPHDALGTASTQPAEPEQALTAKASSSSSAAKRLGLLFIVLLLLAGAGVAAWLLWPWTENTQTESATTTESAASLNAEAEAEQAPPLTANEEVGARGQAPIRQEVEGTGQAPNGQEVEGTGQAPNGQEVEGPSENPRAPTTGASEDAGPSAAAAGNPVDTPSSLAAPSAVPAQSPAQAPDELELPTAAALTDEASTSSETAATCTSSSPAFIPLSAGDPLYSYCEQQQMLDRCFQAELSPASSVLLTEASLGLSRAGLSLSERSHPFTLLAEGSNIRIEVPEQYLFASFSLEDREQRRYQLLLYHDRSLTRRTIAAFQRNFQEFHGSTLAPHFARRVELSGDSVEELLVEGGKGEQALSMVLSAQGELLASIGSTWPRLQVLRVREHGKLQAYLLDGAWGCDRMPSARLWRYSGSKEAIRFDAADEGSFTAFSSSIRSAGAQRRIVPIMTDGELEALDVYPSTQDCEQALKAERIIFDAQ